MLAITRKYADDTSKMGELRHPTNIKPLQEGQEKTDYAMVDGLASDLTRDPAPISETTIGLTTKKDHTNYFYISFLPAVFSTVFRLTVDLIDKT